jgi:hypothetical protein
MWQLNNVREGEVRGNAAVAAWLEVSFLIDPR